MKITSKQESARDTPTSTTMQDENDNAAPQLKNQNEKGVVQWITTHLFHAKRFHMADLWGWQIPMVHTNRGPKAALRLIREGKTLVQDTTWKMAEPIVLECIIKDGGLEQMQSCMRRLCPDFQIQPSTTNKKHVSIQTGHGMLYALDRFPHNAVGPVSWFISKGRPLVTDKHDEGASNDAFSSNDYFVYFWGHPVVRSATLQEFRSLVESCESNSEQWFSMVLTNSSCGVGMACLQLRGIHATKTVKSVLYDHGTATVSTSEANGEALFSYATTSRLLVDDELPQKIPPGTALLVLLKDDNHKTAKPGMQEDRMGEQAPWIQGHRALLISRSLGASLNQSQNAPAFGWDIYCDASVAKDLFLSLVLMGQACPIGLVEESFIQLECQPPIANIFPRDFPETEEGRKYWQVQPEYIDAEDDSSDNKSSTDLNILRLCLEEGEGGGRVHVPSIIKRCRTSSGIGKAKPCDMKISPNRLTSIHWNEFVQNNDDDDPADDANQQPYDSAVVMMRGLFGKPLMDAMSGSGNVPMQLDGGPDTLKNKHVKLRRRVKQPNEVRHVLPLSSDEKEPHVTISNTLLQSLSLPAVIACHLQVVGTGTLKPGASIHATNEEGEAADVMGCVAAAAFSVGRGLFHGTGIVGASHLLKAIVVASSSSQNVHNNLAVVASHGMKQIHLIAIVKHGQKIAKVTLGLIL